MEKSMSSLKTESFRVQNKMISDYINILNDHLSELTISNYSNTIYKILTNFIRILKVTLTMKKSALYPVLLIHYDKDINANAKNIFEKLNGINENFLNYETRWKSSYEIKKNSHEFIETSKKIIEDLKEIINEEETKLFPLIDKLQEK